MYKKQDQKGFTIIEVLIVLAIAGLILLIVFLAVPALQRNSRNTSIKNDVQNVLGGIAEFNAANQGKLPNSISGTGTVTYDITGVTTDTPTTISIQGSTAVSSGTTAPTTPPANGTIYVHLGHKCDGSANARAAAAFYSIETQSSSTVQQCTDS